MFVKTDKYFRFRCNLSRRASFNSATKEFDVFVPIVRQPFAVQLQDNFWFIMLIDSTLLFFFFKILYSIAQGWKSSGKSLISGFFTKI